MSDHGHSVEAASLAGGRSAPYSGSKGTLLEGGIRVPCIATWPGHYPAGVVRRQLVSSMDWLPTLGSHAGASTAMLVLDGHPLQDVIASETAVVHDALCWTHNEMWAVREGRWKLLGEGSDQMSLYDLQADPGESQDLLSQRHDVFRRLAHVRQRWAEGLRQDPTVIRELGL